MAKTQNKNGYLYIKNYNNNSLSFINMVNKTEIDNNTCAKLYFYIHLKQRYRHNILEEKKEIF